MVDDCYLDSVKRAGASWSESRRLQRDVHGAFGFRIHQVTAIWLCAEKVADRESVRERIWVQGIGSKSNGRNKRGQSGVDCTVVGKVVKRSCGRERWVVLYVCMY